MRNRGAHPAGPTHEPWVEHDPVGTSGSTQLPASGRSPECPGTARFLLLMSPVTLNGGRAFLDSGTLKPLGRETIVANLPLPLPPEPTSAACPCRLQAAGPSASPETV